MRNDEYLVTFKTGITSTVYAMCENDAIILAKAQQIKHGNRHDIEKIEIIPR